MCLAFPGRVTEVAPGGVTVSTEGRARRASALLHPEVRPGDWVLVAAGTIVRCLDAAEAEAIRHSLATAIDRTTEREGSTHGKA